MVVKALWQNLKDLVDFDKKIFKIKHDIDSTSKALNEDAAQISKLKNSLEQKKQIYLQLQKNIDSVELESKAFEEEEKLKRKALDNIRNQKEYRAIETEMELARKGRIDLDNKITEAWYQLEIAKNELDAETNRVVQSEAQILKDMEAKQLAIRDLSVQLNTLIEERVTISSRISEDWLAKYERMKHSVEDPIVPVVNSSCSACYYSILQQDLLKLKRSGVLPCRNCYRFLYYDEEEEKALLSAKF